MSGQMTTGEAAVQASVDRLEGWLAAASLQADRLSDSDMERLLDGLPDLADYVAEFSAAVVYVARERGSSWEYIGDHLGVPRQTAHRRYARKVT